jgi:threonylcarbamoyladenosine tRNA methylthiotransferase MtaB
MTDYGKDLPGSPGLGQMVRRLLNLVPNLARLRLSSIDVAEIDAELFDVMTKESRFMPHIHISLQAGNDMVLKRMKRRHTRQQVVDFCRAVREARPEIAFGADIIAGFPTEDDDMFEETRALISEASIQHLHVFPYSEREGTPAAKMPQVAPNIRKERAAILRQEGEMELIRFLERKIGTVESYIVEQDLTARGGDFTHMRLLDHTAIPGQIINARALRVEKNILIGEQVA